MLSVGVIDGIIQRLNQDTQKEQPVGQDMEGVLKFGFKLFNFSLATAAGIFKNAVNIVLLLLANWLAKKAGEERLI